MIRPYQSEFIELCERLGVLRFGSFKLKSGRDSPYFFNAGLVQHRRGDCGRRTRLQRRGDRLGSDLRHVVRTRLQGHSSGDRDRCGARANGTSSMCRLHSIARSRRTTAKAGPIVGAPLQGRVLIVDDVITAGTAIRESIDIIRAAGAHPAGVLLALDREERGARQPTVGGSGGSRTVRDAGDRRDQPVGPHGPYASVRPRRRTCEHAELSGALWPHRLRHTP